MSMPLKTTKTRPGVLSKVAHAAEHSHAISVGRYVHLCFTVNGPVQEIVLDAGHASNFLRSLDKAVASAELYNRTGLG